MSRDVLAAIRRVLTPRGDVELGLVFGSTARGTATSGSDVDVAVLGNAADLLGISAALSRELERDVQVVRLEDAGIPLLESIIEDGVVAFEKRHGTFATWRSHTLMDLELDRPWYARQRDAWLKRVAERGI
ncbi:MAG TPA: nucleotidyltransferase domain-containing protein [Polyangiaceae bacterium]